VIIEEGEQGGQGEEVAHVKVQDETGVVLWLDGGIRAEECKMFQE
jgi:hypothetical protein